jgi:hypothetical protein
VRGEHGPRGVEDPAPVARRVGAEGSGLGGHV